MATRAQPRRRLRAVLHESFLRYAGWRWLRIAAILCVVLIAIYLIDDPKPRPQGDTVYGYTLGTIGALLILWLTALGIRKRKMTAGRWSLKSWTSAHVWLGLSLVVIGTLHTGFHFGWNVHTLAYALMMFVILSGIFGVTVYATLPQRMSENRGELTENQMLEALRAVDRQLASAAQPLSGEAAALVNESLGADVFGTSIFNRLSSTPYYGQTATARHDIIAAGAGQDPQAVARVRALLGEKLGLIQKVRTHLRLRALLEIWLYVHVPATIALIAALIAHIVSVFFYW